MPYLGVGYNPMNFAYSPLPRPYANYGSKPLPQEPLPPFEKKKIQKNVENPLKKDKNLR
jgi:hypothetical protein